jgi:hypothetical protein
MKGLFEALSITNPTSIISFSGEMGNQSKEVNSPVLGSLVVLHPLLCILTNN